MKLTAENYYSKEANLAYMSVSQYKSFLKCEAKALAELQGEYEEPQQDCLLLGSYVHAAIEGPEVLAEFIFNHPEITCSTGKNKGELKAEYKQADVMIQTVLDDDICRMMLEGEKEVIITAELFGTLWKGKLDVYAPEDGRFADLKTVKGIREKYWNPEAGQYQSFVEAYGYTTQMSVYAELERIQARRFERLEPFIVAVSKEESPDKAVICFDEDTMQRELEKVRAKLPRVLAAKRGEIEPHRCEKCRYCRTTKKAQIIHFMNLLEAN